MQSVFHLYRRTIETVRLADGLPLLLLRLYLAPVMMQAGWTKWQGFDDVVSWFGSPDFGLGLPFPALMASLVVAAEFGGGILLLLGVLTRLVSVPLIVTMIVAMVTVHAQHGWLAVADASSWFADGTLYFDEAVMSAPEKLAKANEILNTHGYIDWLTSSGKFVVLNNGIEFAATYLVMLLVLFFYGAGRYVSLDYWVAKKLQSASVRR